MSDHARAANERNSMDRFELAVVLSHYDLGVIESITDFTRGSRQSPKVGIVAERGKYLLKRRSIQRANPDRVGFAHRVQQCLTAFGFPVARLVTTCDGRSLFVTSREYLYELFVFVPGQTYDQSIAQTRSAGRWLAEFHAATEKFAAARGRPEPHGDFHDVAGVRTGLCQLGPRLSSHDSFSGDEAELAGHLHALLERYDEAAESVTERGYEQLPVAVAHSDWHPGNLLFRGEEVVAVVDYDSVRWSRRVADLANGALQFSLQSRGEIEQWDVEVDMARFEAFVGGYASAARVTENERQMIPQLMCEALISECVHPIAATGSVGPWAGFRVLRMVRAKVDWINNARDRLIAAASCVDASA